MKTNKLTVFQAVLLSVVIWIVPQLGQADIEWENMQKLSLQSRTLDLTTSFDGKTAFMLTPGEILIYSIEDNKISARIPVDPIYDRIAYTEGDRLVLSAGDPATITIIKYSTIYDIDISDRPVKGNTASPVTLVVFDDYQ